MSASYTIVAYRAEDLPKEYVGMIFSKWLRSLRFGNDYFKLIDVDAYYRRYHMYIDTVLTQQNAEVRLAVLTDDHDVVLGFAVTRGEILDFVHVHKHQRRQGIGRDLVPPGITTITHVTKTGLTIWGSKYSEWKFDPFA